MEYKLSTTERQSTPLLLIFEMSTDSKCVIGESAGGGIIALLYRSEIVFDGVLISNGSGDSGYCSGFIPLCADGAVIYRGITECKSNGRITVQCHQFVNEEMIAPEPKIFIAAGTEQREIEMVINAVESECADWK